jgi:hypothetical protein
MTTGNILHNIYELLKIEVSCVRQKISKHPNDKNGKIDNAALEKNNPTYNKAVSAMAI